MQRARSFSHREPSAVAFDGTDRHTDLGGGTGGSGTAAGVLSEGVKDAAEFKKRLTLARMEHIRMQGMLHKRCMGKSVYWASRHVTLTKYVVADKPIASV